MSIATQITRLQGAKAALKTSIEGKGVEVPEATKIDGYAALVDAIQQGGGQVAVPPCDVNFYDYDGTIVAAYTAAEFAVLEALPANPSHDGLTAQGWNWTLEAAKTHVAAYGTLAIGQNYITADGKTRLYISIPTASRKTITIYFNQAATSTIAWGDGNTESASGTGEKSLAHEYAAPGEYVIEIDPGEGQAISFPTAMLGTGAPYRTYLRRVELGRVNSINSFADYFGLESITIPTNITSFANVVFPRCRSLRGIVIPSGVASIAQQAFDDCNSLRVAVLPASITTLGQQIFCKCFEMVRQSLPAGPKSIPSNLFNTCVLLASIVIPEGVTSIVGGAFAACSTLVEVVLPSTIASIGDSAFVSCPVVKSFICKATTPPTLGSSALPSAADMTIYVPSEAVEDYKAASGWSAYATKIQAIPTE